MATQTYTHFQAQDFFDILMPDLPGAGQLAVRQELDRVLREFFIHTGAWQERITPKDPLPVGQVVIDLNDELVNFAAFYKVAQVYAVWDGLVEVPKMALVRQYKLATSQTLRRWHSPHRGVVEFTGTLWDTARTLEYQVSLYPREQSVSYPQWIWDDHSEAIRSGVLGRMMSQGRKPYSNPEEGRLNLRKYRAAINTSRAEADAGLIAGARTWTYPRSFA